VHSVFLVFGGLQVQRLVVCVEWASLHATGQLVLFLTALVFGQTEAGLGMRLSLREPRGHVRIPGDHVRPLLSAPVLRPEEPTRVVD